jgi:hypothetical protein
MACPARAEPTLEGRLVTFFVLTCDDPAQPLLTAHGRTVQVRQGVEFGLEPEGLINGLDVAPVTVQIGPRRIEVEYTQGPGVLWRSVFNGYVLRFETYCAVFETVTIDADYTTMPLKPADIRTEIGALYINVAGMDYGPGKRFAVDMKVADCPLS